MSGDTIVRFKDGEYELNAFAGVTHVDGSAAAIDRVQRSSAHFMQRPDADYLQYNPLRTSMGGTKSGVNIAVGTPIR